jgi:hypothetical protein
MRKVKEVLRLRFGLGLLQKGAALLRLRLEHNLSIG